MLPNRSSVVIVSMQYSAAAGVDFENCNSPGHLLCFTLASCVAVLAVQLSTGADNTDDDWEPDSVVDSTSKGKRDGSIPGIYIVSPLHYAGGTHTLCWHSW